MTKLLKIGFDAKRAFMNPTGLGSYSRNTIQALQASYPGNDYYLFTPSVKAGLFTAPDPMVTIAPQGQWWKSVKPVWRSYKVTELSQKMGLDLFHGLSHELPVGLEKAGIRSVVTFHDLIILRYPKYYRAADRRIYYRKYKHSARVADKIIAISEQTKDDLMHYMGVDESKIEVLYQSINPLFFEKSAEEALAATREKYRLPGEFILIPGTLEKRKNQANVLKAILEQKIDMPVVVVGKMTNYMKELKELVAELKDQLIFLQYVPMQDLAHLYQLAHLCVFVSQFEGFGLPVAEAQACGCPVVTAWLSSMPEVGAQAATYVDPFDPESIGYGLMSLLNNANQREQKIALGHENAERFRPERYADDLMRIYQSL
ncbi:glycosyltransferase family 1 protein [Mangrovibacterium marinum]|uniref:Glycosyltransferase involved in cell wall biosynthesis n=1 Tax=Mangrovibacterium marinum TaxID=1639118 RepID=A0A2T5C6J9_9BACT|nr:glycosyltransferase family 1 protein [Mangrovibacterium marinum]PTN10561.1 glycosyltransferase involved in cell wall biosynthesis [Mangrovibacterium marinum]